MQEDLDARDDSGVWPELAALQESCRRIAAEQARQVALTSRLVRRVTAQARLELASRPRVPGQPDDDQVIDSAVTGEVMAGLGVSRHDAGRLVDLADRLVRVLPATLVALADGTIDLGRAEALSSATAVLSDADARVVEAALLPQAGTRPWDGASPRAWRDRLQRVVVRTDRFAAQRRRREAIADRCVRAWPNGSGTSDLLIRGADCDVVMAEHVLTDLALASPEVGPDGGHRTLDQRRD
ncbi:MAG: DUF222 domain-containing protein, partial [Actinomycetes bacterium]